MLNFRLLFIPLLCTIFLFNCGKRDYASVDDLEVTLTVLDPEGRPTTAPPFGEDYVFMYTIRNSSDHEVEYRGTPCPQFQLEVYDEDGQFVGRPVESDAVCPDKEDWAVLGEGEPQHFASNWKADPTNPTLRGHYTVRIKTWISVLEGKEQREYDLETAFEVQ